MARTELQWESFRQLQWALSFAQADLDSARKDELKRLGYELGVFVRKAAGVGSVETSTNKTEKRLSMVQSGLKARFHELAEMRPVRVADRDGIRNSQLSSTNVPAEGSVQLIAIEGDPYRQMVQSHKIETQVYAALASHVTASGIVGGQIRICPECARLFILKIKPQPNREFHCSTPCTNRATFRRFTEKKLELGRQLDEKLKAKQEKEAKRQRTTR